MESSGSAPLSLTWRLSSEWNLEQGRITAHHLHILHKTLLQTILSFHYVPGILRKSIKPQWDIISHLSEWSSSTNQQISAGEDVEKGEPFCTLDGNAHQCSYCGKQCGHTSKNKKLICLLTQVSHYLEYIQRNPKH